ncbi:CHAT domain-containing protein [Armillaria nabsnona]|nr:CHAT domain-containing protein [Armillaria nabsnona]
MEHSSIPPVQQQDNGFGNLQWKGLASDELNCRGTSHLARFVQLGALPDVNQAISDLEEAVALTPDDHPDISSRLNNLGSAFLARYQALGNISDLNGAITNLELTIAITPANDARKPGRLSNLGSAYSSRFKQSGDINDINEAISSLEQAVGLTTDGHVSRATSLSNLGGTFLTRFESLGDAADTDRAVSLRDEALALTPTGHPEKHKRYKNLGISLLGRFGARGVLSDLDRAIDVLNLAVHLAPDHHVDRADHLSDLGTAYLRRFVRSSKVEDINHAIVNLQNAVLLSPGSLPKAGCLSNVGGAYLAQFERSGDLEHLNRSIDALEQSLSLTPDDHVSNPAVLSNLGGAYLIRFMHLGELRDIDKAVLLREKAVDQTQDDHADMPGRLSNLGCCFLTRFDRLRIPSDIDKALSILEIAVAITPEDHPDAPGRFAYLGGSYLTKFKSTKARPDIDLSVSFRERAVAITPDDHGFKPRFLSDLGGSLFARFEQFEDPADADSAVVMMEKAVGLLDVNHSDRSGYLNNLGNAFHARFDHSRRPEDIDRAVHFLNQAVSSAPDGHAFTSGFHGNLARSLYARFQLVRDPSDLTRSLENYRASAESTSGNPTNRFHSARTWAKLSLEHDNKPSLEAHELALSLIPRIVWLGVGVTQRYDEILAIGDEASEAAAAAIALQKVDLAVEWLEQARSIVWGQLLRLRTPVDDLRSERPDLASELEGVSKQLENASAPNHLPTSPALEESEAQMHRRLAERYEALIAEGRRVPGFEQFFQPRPVHELVSTARFGTVVIINVHPSRCDAFVVREGVSATVRHVPLPCSSHKAATSLYLTLVKSLQHLRVRSEFRADRPYLGNKGDPNSAMKTVLEQLWISVVEPVLRDLAYTNCSSRIKLPSVTWCATGPLAFLPLHAAGLHDGPNPHKVFDYVVSSYTPTLTALINATNKCRSPLPSILAVSQPSTSGQSSLPGTISEVETIKRRVANSGISFTWLNAEKGTVEAVLEGMKTHSWCHLACHGVQRSGDPTKSAFLLHDGALELARIMSTTFDSAEVAFLSACQTATGDTERPEEAIHLSAGMLIAGYRTVFATMWSIGDTDAPVVADEVYAYLLEARERGERTENEAEERPAAYAIHRAIARLREKVGEQAFHKWVPFMHVGA